MRINIGAMLPEGVGTLANIGFNTIHIIIVIRVEALLL
jgi:hypothetical protein